MKLTFEQIKNLSFGAAYVEERDEKTIFHRFNQQEEELYKAVGYKFYKKTLANSCITIEFQTNSASLFLKTCVTPRSSRNFYSHDVYVDGVFCDSLKGIVDLPDDNSIRSEIVEKNFVLGENGKLKNIRIHLPWSCSSDIKSFPLMTEQRSSLLIKILIKKQKFFYTGILSHKDMTQITQAIPTHHV